MQLRVARVVVDAIAARSWPVNGVVARCAAKAIRRADSSRSSQASHSLAWLPLCLSSSSADSGCWPTDQRSASSQRPAALFGKCESACIVLVD
jgi:hypothetical protein